MESGIAAVSGDSCWHVGDFARISEWRMILNSRESSYHGDHHRIRRHTPCHAVTHWYALCQPGMFDSSVGHFP